MEYVCFHDEIFLDAHTSSNLKKEEKKKRGVCEYIIIIIQMNNECTHCKFIQIEQLTVATKQNIAF